jgi:hypothetical protein
LVSLTVVLLAACSTGGENDTNPTSATTEATTSASAPTTPVATIEQWAGEVAALRQQYDESQGSWDDSACTPSLIEADPICSAYLTVLGLTAQTADITLTGLQNPDGPTYLGSVPDEIAAVLAETTEAAGAAFELSEAVACPGDECVSTAFQFTRAWDDLGTAYAKWEPYL